ncbi:unnamed protein product [Sphacelaria rigidula]
MMVMYPSPYSPFLFFEASQTSGRPRFALFIYIMLHAQPFLIGPCLSILKEQPRLVVKENLKNLQTYIYIFQSSDAILHDAPVDHAPIVPVASFLHLHLD